MMIDIGSPNVVWLIIDEFLDIVHIVGRFVIIAVIFNDSGNGTLVVKFTLVWER